MLKFKILMIMWVAILIFPLLREMIITNEVLEYWWLRLTTRRKIKILAKEIEGIIDNPDNYDVSGDYYICRFKIHTTKPLSLNECAFLRYKVSINMGEYDSFGKAPLKAPIFDVGSGKYTEEAFTQEFFIN